MRCPYLHAEEASGSTCGVTYVDSLGSHGPFEQMLRMSQTSTLTLNASEVAKAPTWSRWLFQCEDDD